MFCTFCRSLRLPKRPNARFISKGSLSMTEQVETAGVQKIDIPRRIKRTPLSILQALSSTVETDYNSPNYNYVDDPYLISFNHLGKKYNSFAKASGKKAAQWVLKDQAKNFNALDMDDPKIEAFCAPKLTYDIEGVSQEALLERIEMKKTVDAFEMYKTLTDQGEKISIETANKLLDLLCFFNSQDPLEAVPSEELFFPLEQRDSKHKDTSWKKSWKDGDAADIVFKDMSVKNEAAYDSIIRGMRKHHNTEMAYRLYSEAVSCGLVLDISTYNAVIYMTNHLYDEYYVKWNAIQNTLELIRDSKIQPNVQTFNAVLYSLHKIPRWQQCKRKAIETINEMKALGLEPSLATWLYFVKIFYPNEEAENDMLYQIIDYTKDRQYHLTFNEDFFFIKEAMYICNHNLKDVDLAYKIEDMRSLGNNANMMGDNVRQSLYFTLLFRLIVSVEPIEKTMEFYEKYLPHIWVPGFKDMSELLYNLELHDGYQYIPTIWSDLLLFGLTYREDMIDLLLRMMTKETHDEQLQNQFSDLVWKFKDKLDYEITILRKFRLSSVYNGTLVGYMILVFCRSNEIDKAWKVFEDYKKKRDTSGKNLSETALTELCEACLGNKDREKVMKCLLAMSNLKYDTKKLCEDAKKQLELTEFQIQQLEAVLQ